VAVKAEKVINLNNVVRNLSEPQNGYPKEKFQFKFSFRQLLMPK